MAEPGQTVAIVGPTGAANTTLVNLVMRFYELDAGRITLDGVDVTSVPRRELLPSRLGMVLQDTWLFGGTIRDNIAYGRPSATEDEILEAARATYVDRFVRSLPEGYDTMLEDEGSNVSVGEKQLLTIARVFLARPSVLILDEATSSVDTRTEVLVQKAMRAAVRPDFFCDRAPAVHYPRRRPHPGDGDRADGGAGGHTRRCWRRAGPMRGCMRRSSRLRWRSYKGTAQTSSAVRWDTR
ncbi:ABC-type bacteriocin/lantibiotic exporter with double-glycine peptidase domain [Pseudarthrobacter sp. PvP022]